MAVDIQVRPTMVMKTSKNIADIFKHFNIIIPPFMHIKYEHIKVHIRIEYFGTMDKIGKVQQSVATVVASVDEILRHIYVTQ